jgi:DNA-directed RNA polymerase
VGVSREDAADWLTQAGLESNCGGTKGWGSIMTFLGGTPLETLRPDGTDRVEQAWKRFHRGQLKRTPNYDALCRWTVAAFLKANPQGIIVLHTLGHVFLAENGKVTVDSIPKPLRRARVRHAWSFEKTPWLPPVGSMRRYLGLPPVAPKGCPRATAGDYLVPASIVSSPGKSPKPDFGSDIGSSSGPQGDTNDDTKVITLTYHRSDTLGETIGETSMDLLEEQEALESLLSTWGEDRYYRRLEKAYIKGDPSRVGAGRKILSEAVSKVIPLVQQWLDAQQRPGARHTAYKWVSLLGVEETAYLTVRGCMDVMAGPKKLSTVASGVSSLILSELKARRFQELAPHLFAYRMASFTTKSAAHMARSLSGTARGAACQACHQEGRLRCEHMDFSDLSMGQEQKIRVGLKLIDFMMAAFPGFLESATIPRGMATLQNQGASAGRMRRRSKRTDSLTILRVSEEAAEWIDKRNEILAAMTPIYGPMVVPPVDWAPGVPGGYRYSLKGRASLVKGSSQQRKEVAAHALPEIYDAVNRIQQTPWKINSRVLEVVRALARRGGGRAGLPEVEPLEKPRRDPRLDEEDPPEELLREWKRAKHRWHRDENARQMEAATFMRALTLAETVEHYEAIWFPWSLDFRGRAYPIPVNLQPQGNDLARGLLTFAAEEPIGEDGIRWLALHGSTCIDEWEGQKIARLTLDERVALIERITPDILAAAEDPMGVTWWQEVEYPFKTLAFCFEWAEVQAHGADYCCSLPVSVDGSCNGLQHFAALLRDEEGARAVNVLPSERPQDVYTSITERVLDRLEEAAGQDHWARVWLGSGLVDRKLCKRPTMTFGYGSGRYGFTEQIREHLGSALDDDRFLHEGRWQGTPACSYLAQHILDALSEVVKGAYDAREWLQSVARLIASRGRYVRWWAPLTGFPVYQDGFHYWKQKDKQVDTFIGGVRYQPQVRIETSEPNTLRQANGVAPNYVHSIDAAAMMLTVNTAAEEGVLHFAMVHDSFGTIPARMSVLSAATRQAFYRIYTTTDPLQDLYFQLIDQALMAGVDINDIEEPPEPGSLDLAGVLASAYFFS